jgi:hypothetical protein
MCIGIELSLLEILWKFLTVTHIDLTVAILFSFRYCIYVVELKDIRVIVNSEQLTAFFLLVAGSK